VVFLISLAIGVALPMFFLWRVVLFISAYPPFLSLLPMGMSSAIMAIRLVVRWAREQAQAKQGSSQQAV
jgi:hypothetical protein